MPRAEIKRQAFEQVLDDCLLVNPNQPICMAKLGRIAGFSKEGARENYYRIAATKEVPPIKARKLSISEEEFDQKVAELCLMGLDDKTISDRLLISVNKVILAKRRLRSRQKESRDNLVILLRKQGCGDKEIAGRTGINFSTVGAILPRYWKDDKTLRLRRPRMSSEQIIQLDEQVKGKWEEGLTGTQVAEAINRNYFDVINSLNRLRRLQKIQPRK